MDATTFTQFLTPAGIVVAAGLVMGLIQLLKGAFPALDAHVSGAALAFALTGVLYLITGIATMVGTLDAGLVVFEAWLACATAAVGAYSTVKHMSA